MRLAPNRFYLVTGSAFGVRDSGWVRRHLPCDGSVEIRDVTSGLAVINLVGPKARAVLQAATLDDVSNTAFPYLAVREIEIGLARVRAARVGYVGELGWELHTPAEQALHVYEMLREAGEAYGIADAGYRAIETLRLEKGYVYWSSDVTPDTNPFEAGLGFAVALDKGDFIGRSALAAIKVKGTSAASHHHDGGWLCAADRWRSTACRRQGYRYAVQRRLWLHRRQDDCIWLHTSGHAKRGRA